MGALVAIPHHYLGFIYIGIFFLLIIISPWLNEYNDDDIWGDQDTGDNESWSSPRWDVNHSFNFANFLWGAMFATAIVPTGKYFMSIGSMDGLSYTYWIAILYTLILAKIAFYLIRLLFKIFNSAEWSN
jgi:hypothetical protein